MNRVTPRQSPFPRPAAWAWVALLGMIAQAGCHSTPSEKPKPLTATLSQQDPPRLYVVKAYSPEVQPVVKPAPTGRPGNDDEIDPATDDPHPPVLGAEPNMRAASVATSQPSGAHSSATSETLTGPYTLNIDSIMKLVYSKSPMVLSSRENMIAAQYALSEFRANLSRVEPFVRTSGDMTNFPERRHSEGVSGEMTGGLEMETFDGAKIRLEGGMRGERVKFGDVAEGQDEVESGSGGVIRARVEVPFAGSRLRQNRVISEAFQDSSARKAELNYVSDFGKYVGFAMAYYDAALYYRDYAQAYEHQLATLNSLLENPQMHKEDLARIESVAGDTRVVIANYQASYRSYLLLLLEYVGIGPGEDYSLEERPLDQASKYYDLALTEEGRQQMLVEAFENNPTFRVLNDAIEDSRLKRQQAIDGKHDITTFIEGTQFAFGSESFDDRVGGWQVMGGVTFRLNDPRVLTASREKAEAEIRQFEAQIDAEKLRVQREVMVESMVLTSYHESRPDIYLNLQQTQNEYAQRLEDYFSEENDSISIDDVISSLSSVTVADIRLANNVYYSRLSEDDLLSATGEVYRRVGLDMEEDTSAKKD